MKILLAHNYYQLGGGEDSVVANEKKLLEENGNEVITYFKHNKEINTYSKFKKLELIQTTSFSKASYADLIQFLKIEQPDICHVHNFLPLISPAIYSACNDLKIPVIQTLHNYRLICTNGLLFRDGRVCEDCLSGSIYGSVIKKCYRNSSIQTYAIAKMIDKNRGNGTWNHKVDAYFCLTEFAKKKFVDGGLPEEKIIIKPNFVEQPILEPRNEIKSPYLIFVGRLDSTKGVNLLIEIANELPLPLKIVGEGDLSKALEGKNNIELLGKLSNIETQRYMRQATALIFPSIWYEGMPMTILEAFANQTLVISSDLGAMQSIIQDQKNGLLFAPNSSTDLMKQIKFAINETALSSEMVSNAHQDFLKKYSKESNYKQLIATYSRIIQEKKDESIRN